MTRLLLVLAAIGATACALLLLPFEEHTVSYTHTETILGETDGFPFVILLVILAALVWAALGTFPRGLVAGISTSAGVLLAAVTIALEHILVDPIHDTAGQIALLCLPFLLFDGLAIAAAELFLHRGERRRLEATDPVFPTARVV